MIKADLKGDKEFIRNLEKQMSEVTEAAYRGLKGGALMMVSDAKPLTPVKTGNLKKSAYVHWKGKSVSVPAFLNDPDKRIENYVQLLKKGYARRMKLASTTVKDTPHKKVVEAGYGVYYADVVHETHPHGMSKFFSIGVQRNLNKTVKLMTLLIAKALKKKVSYV